MNKIWGYRVYDPSTNYYAYYKRNLHNRDQYDVKDISPSSVWKTFANQSYIKGFRTYGGVVTKIRSRKEYKQLLFLDMI